MPSPPAIFYRSCNFCGGQDFRRYRSLDNPFPAQLYRDAPLSCPDIGRHLKLQYLECVACGLLGINPLTHFSEIDRHSFDGEIGVVAWADNDYRSYEKGKRDLTHYYNQYLALDRYRRLNRFLDVSCGPGVTLDWLAKNAGWQVFGIDPDRHSVKMAHERYGLTIANGLIADLPDANESFDVVWMDNSLEHSFDPLGTLLAAWRLLRKGGALVILVPNSDALHVQLLDWHMYWGHWFLYSPLPLFRLLTRIGFTVIKLKATQEEFSPELPRRGVDIDKLRPLFHVAAPASSHLEQVLLRTPCYADFFTMVAIKPENANEVSPNEGVLKEIAAASRLQRDSVRLRPDAQNSDIQFPTTGTLINSLERRLIRQPDGVENSDRVYFVENGIRHWVLSASWLQARGFWFPDDVAAIPSDLFLQLPEGPPLN